MRDEGRPRKDGEESREKMLKDSKKREHRQGERDKREMKGQRTQSKMNSS